MIYYNLKEEETTLVFDYLETPIGLLKIIADENFLKALFFTEEQKEISRKNEIIDNTINQLNAYFKGTLKQFDLPLKPDGTDFQQQVWKQLQTIPYGKTISYLELSEQIGNKKAVRAVGSANGKNPIPIIIPCHRVIGANGKLVGYSGGLWRKEYLLSLEGFPIQKGFDF